MADAFSCTLAGIILAAGHGKRLASIAPKPLLTFHGKTFLQLVIDHLSAIGVTQRIIVTNKALYQRIVDFHPATQVVINPQPEMGMISSLWIGMAAMGPDVSGFFMCPIDYPLVQRETFRRLSAAHISNPHRIIIPTHNGRFGHPIIFSKDFFQALRHVPLDQGARFLIRRNQDRLFQVEVTDPGILININTPELYHRYCK